MQGLRNLVAVVKLYQKRDCPVLLSAVSTRGNSQYNSVKLFENHKKR